MESLAPWAGRNRKTDMEIVSVVNTAQMVRTAWVERCGQLPSTSIHNSHLRCLLMFLIPFLALTLAQTVIHTHRVTLM